MKTRLILLVLVAAGLAVAVGVKFSAPPDTKAEQEELTAYDPKDGTSLTEMREMQKELAMRDLPGEEPDIPAEFVLNVSVDPTGKKNRLYVDVTEVHGYYVETLKFGFWYKMTPEMHYDESPLAIEHFVDAYIPANESLRVCMDFVHAELNKAEGVMGTGENWGAVVLQHGRVRAENPDPLPSLANAFDCD